ncbi:hypothetical protein AB0M54_41010 [Actinoplanes sp. NPDC051470]|uniref:hypothetical protein n=1 Tax=Actinoplanes sp. NPDC051470 TaxID=3157224 RepID=UPI00342D8D28
MADQPGGNPPDARSPDPTRIAADGDPSTVDAPARWSGSAAIPPPQPKKSLWPRRTAAAADEDDDWGTTPAVDPWAGQDTPWDPLQLPAPMPAPAPMPPTRIEAPAPPPTRIDAPAPAPAPAPPPLPPPPPPKPTRAEKREAKRAQKQPPPPVNRVPVQPRPTSVPPEYARQVVQRPPGPPRPPGLPGPQRPPRKGLPPPRKKRRPLRTLGTFALLSLVFCAGVPAIFLWPAAGQYPVSASLPDSVSDLDRRDDATSRRAAQRLAAELSDGGQAFAGIYADGNGKRVTIFGTTGLRITPEQDVEAQIRQLTPDYDIEDVRPFDMGETGVHERCGKGRAGRNTVVVCAWADHGSLVTVLMTRRSIADSADLTAVLRSAVLNRG